MKTSSLTPYLYFGGNAEEAIHFYEKALDATVEVLMRFKECPDPIPEEHQFPGFEEAIMHATLTIYGQPLKLSDGCEPGSSIQGFGLSLSLPSKEAATHAFEALSEGGTVKMPLGETFWSSCFGMVTDRFQVDWLVSIEDG